MAETKTKPTNASVLDFIQSFANTEQKRKDSVELIKLMQDITGHEPKMWGPSIVGFGSYHYKYASGHEGDSPLAGFSPRKDSLVVYVATEFEKREELLAQLGKHKNSKSCLYIKKLDDIDMVVLRKIIKNSMDQAIKQYPPER